MTESQLDTAQASRRQFLVLGAAAGAAVLVLPKLPAQAQSTGDMRALRFLETLELFQADFFTKAAISGSSEVLPSNQSSLISLISKQDLEQARWFRMAQKRYAVAEHVQGTLSSPRAAKFKGSSNDFNSPKSLLESAIVVKETAVAAFQGQIEGASRPELVQAIAQLAGVQNRHLALLRQAAGQAPFASVNTISASQAYSRIAKFGFSEDAWK